MAMGGSWLLAYIALQMEGMPIAYTVCDLSLASAVITCPIQTQLLLNVWHTQSCTAISVFLWLTAALFTAVSYFSDAR